MKQYRLELLGDTNLDRKFEKSLENAGPHLFNSKLAAESKFYIVVDLQHIQIVCAESRFSDRCGKNEL